MSRVLFITDDRLGQRMAGPAIRAVELARHLARHLSAEVATLQPLSEGWTAPVATHVCTDEKALLGLAADFDVLVAGGFVFAQHPGLSRLGKYLVLDLYDPMLLEELARNGSGPLASFLYREHHRWLAEQMRMADFMVCASQRQRDYWLGRLCALGRLDPAAYAADPTASRLIDVVPFGLNLEPPAREPAHLRGVVPGLAPGDRVLVWGGGLWDWLDPLSPIGAVARLQADHPSLKLVFLAGPSPNPTTPASAMNQRARELAEQVGVLGRSVFFHDEWVPYAERGAWLAEADAGFTAHHEHLETRYSFRTRVLDYLWAGLPILSSAGDAMGDLVERHGLGLTVDCQDVDGWEKAFRRVATEQAWLERCREAVAAVRPSLSWDAALAPLERYCRAPYRSGTPAGTRLSLAMRGPLSLLAKAGLSLREEGVAGLLERVRRRRARRSGHA